jgi:transcriptional regulator with XRE-family HTH domain
MSNDEKPATPPRVPVIVRKSERPTGRGPAYQVSPKAEASAQSPRSKFSANLARRIRDKGYSQAAFARACEVQLPDGGRFGRDSVSGYIRNGNIPDPMRVKAMCAVLGCTEEDLVHGALSPVAGGEIHAPSYSNEGLGQLRLNVDQVVSLSDMVALVTLLSGFDVGEDGLMLSSLDSDNVRLRVAMTVPTKVGLGIVSTLEDLYAASMPDDDGE